MRPTKFHIVFQMDAWRYITDEVTSGPYRTQAQALHAAEEFVRVRSVDAHVRIYRFDGVPQEERTYSPTMANYLDRDSKAISPVMGTFYPAEGTRKGGE